MIDLPNEYLKFINECKKRVYNTKLVILHRHHILPRFMGGTDTEDNIIILDTTDHYNAHILLANSYMDSNKHYYAGNIVSANLIKRHFNGKTPEEYSAACKILCEKYPRKVSESRKKFLSENMCGENNPFYGKTHTINTKKKMSRNHANVSGGNNPAAKQCIDKLTGKIYGSIKEMAADLNRRRCTIGKYVKDKNNERFCYVE